MSLSETQAENASGAESPSVLHVFRSPLGGLFRHVKDLALGQASRGCRVGLVFDAHPADEATRSAIAALSEHMALGVHRLPMKRGAAFGDITNVAAIMRLCAKLNPDVLHGHGAKGGFYARAGALNPFSKLPLKVYTPHGGSVHYWDRRVLGLPTRGIEILLARSTDVFLFESKFIAGRYADIMSIPAERCFISPNGLRDDEFTPVRPAPERADFIFLGELRHLKGVDVLIDAMGEMQRRVARETTAVIVGSGPDRACLEDYAKLRGLSERIRFVGPLPCAQALGMGRVLVTPSRRESLPYTVLEALAGGMPIVATTAGGIPEIFGPYADRLVPPGDAVALAKALVTMLDATDDERARLSDELLQHVRRRFSLENMIDNSLAAYREGMLRQRRPGHAQPSLLSTP